VPHPDDEADVRAGLEEAKRGEFFSEEESAAYLRGLLGDTRVSPATERELHLELQGGAASDGDTSALWELQKLVNPQYAVDGVAPFDGEDALVVVVWELVESGRVELGRARYHVNFEELVADDYVVQLLKRLGARFAA
jgi:hypothetical protein